MTSSNVNQIRQSSTRHQKRLTLKLFPGSKFENEFMSSIFDRGLAAKQEAECVRRYLCQGRTLIRIFKRIDFELEDIEREVERIIGYSGDDYKDVIIRVNTDAQNTPEVEIQSVAAGLKSRQKRRLYLRRLAFYGFWLESLPEKSTELIGTFFSVGTAADGGVAKSETGVSGSASGMQFIQNEETKHNFKDLMP